VVGGRGAPGGIGDEPRPDPEAGHGEASKPTTMKTCRQVPMPATIRLNPDIEARLDRLASRTGRTKAFTCVA